MKYRSHAPQINDFDAANRCQRERTFVQMRGRESCSMIDVSCTISHLLTCVFNKSIILSFFRKRDICALLL